MLKNLKFSQHEYVTIEKLCTGIMTQMHKVAQIFPSDNRYKVYRKHK